MCLQKNVRNPRSSANKPDPPISTNATKLNLPSFKFCSCSSFSCLVSYALWEYAGPPTVLGRVGWLIGGDLLNGSGVAWEVRTILPGAWPTGVVTDWITLPCGTAVGPLPTYPAGYVTPGPGTPGPGGR